MAYMIRRLMLLALLLCSCRPVTVAPQNQPQPRTAIYSTYLPYLSSGTAKPTVGPCSGSVIEQQLAFLFVSDPGQKRRHPTCSPQLMRAAAHRAQDMVDNKYFSHNSPDGITPNETARRFGCTLPTWYEVSANNIESIGLNASSASQAWQMWKDSPAHRVHVLGEIDFWAEQNSYGIAVAESAWGRVFVLMTAPGCERVKDD